MSFPNSATVSLPTVVPQSQPQAVSGAGRAGTLFPDVGRIRHLAEQIRQRCAHAHLTGPGQQATTFQVLLYYPILGYMYT